MIIEYITNYVRTECNSPENVFTDSFFEQHISLVVEYAEMLSIKCNADKEIVKLAALLHDISAIKDINTLPVHNTESAKIAEHLLREHNYPEEKIACVRDAIIRHPVPVSEGMGTPEEICVSNADAMSQIVNPAYWFFYTFKVRKLSFSEGRDWFKNKVRFNWNTIISPAKAMIENEYIIVQQLYG